MNKGGSLLGARRHVILALIAFVYAWMLNKSTPWPAILSDTVAYLVNAAIFSGERIDAMGSWHAGYSFFLTPLFGLDDPFDIWSAAQVVNASFVAGGAYLSSRLLMLIEPELDWRLHFVVLLAIVLYPSFAGQAGMGQSSAGLTLAVMCLACLFASKRCFTFAHVLVLALIAGIAYWIHPIGMAVIGAAALSLLSIYKRVGWRNLTAFGLVVTGIAAFYKFVVHEWMYQAVTPDGFPRYNHYLAGAPIQEFVSIRGLGSLFQYILGQTAYQLVGGLGLVLLGVLYGVRQFVPKTNPTFGFARSADIGRKVVSIFAIAVLALAILLGSVNFLLASVWITRTDHWIYGRYSDSVVLPLLVLGVAAFLGTARNLIGTPLKLVIFFGVTAIGLLAVGVLLQLNLNFSLVHSYLTSLGFWPQVVWPEKNFVVWMGLGAVGCLLVGLLWQAPKSIAVSGLLLLFVGHALVSGRQYLAERARIERTHSQPSALVDVVRGTWSRGTCVGFLAAPTHSMEFIERQRFRLYAFMFFNYHYKRVTLEQWLNGCDGPLLTYDPSVVLKQADLQLVAREEATGLFLLARKSQTVVNHKASNPVQALGPIVFASELDEACLIAGCYTWNASQMAQFSHTGVLDGSKWRTNGKAGFLFFGPYRRLDSGQYVLRLTVEDAQSMDAFVDVVSDQARVTHAKQRIGQVAGAKSQLVLPFKLMQSVQDIQVRLYVGGQDSVAISGYSVRMEQAGDQTSAALRSGKP